MRFITAQMTPGHPEQAPWAIVDGLHRGIVGQMLGETLAQAVAEFLEDRATDDLGETQEPVD